MEGDAPGGYPGTARSCPGFARRSSRVGSARPAPGTPDPALPPGSPRPAEPLDAPGHDSSTLAGPGVVEVPVQAAPRSPGDGIVDLRPVPALLVTHRLDQGWPRGDCCGQPGKAPGQARDAALGGSRSSSPITSDLRTTPPAGSYPPAAARALPVPLATGHQRSFSPDPLRSPADYPAHCPLSEQLALADAFDLASTSAGGSGPDP
jgi:hypothetical protein